MHAASGRSGMHLSLLRAWVGRVAHKTLALAPRPEAPELAQILNEEGVRSFDMHNKAGEDSNPPHMYQSESHQSL